MSAKDARIAELEREVADLKAELQAIERVEELEREMAELRRQVGAKRNALFPYWHQQLQYTGQLAVPNTVNAVATQVAGGLASKATITRLFGDREDPPDMGVLARVS